MYFPYFRGKQFELIAVRNLATLLERSNFTPIIEPVRDPMESESQSSLERALDEVQEASGNVVLVVNPKYGDLARNDDRIAKFIHKNTQYSCVTPGVILDERIGVEEVTKLLEQWPTSRVALIHYGFGDVKSLAQEINQRTGEVRHVFVEPHCGRLYRANFDESEGVLIRDGFEKMPNAEYSLDDFFSDLHITYHMEGVGGFGDFSIVGDEYFDSGGAPYAVALHLTYIAPSKDDAMHICHFVSDSNQTQTDPAGKFLEALTKLVEKVNQSNSEIYETSAIAEFRDLFKQKHYPGLGKLKEMSIRHHVETLARFFSST